MSENVTVRYEEVAKPERPFDHVPIFFKDENWQGLYVLICDKSDDDYPYKIVDVESGYVQTDFRYASVDEFYEKESARSIIFYSAEVVARSV